MTEIKTMQALNNFAASNGPILVDFHATWCGPCRAIAPYLIEQCQKQGVPLAKVDVDEVPEAAQKYSVQAMPTFKILDKAGNVLGEVVGGGQGNVNKCIEIVKSKQ